MDVFVPARIEVLEVLEPGELCRVALSLPDRIDLEGTAYAMQDLMRPGTAFLVKPYGMRSCRFRRRMYTRSNVAEHQPRLLETFINYTHNDRADTSKWWQSKEAMNWYLEGKSLDVRVRVDQKEHIARVYENTGECKAANLRLEEDGVWESSRLVCIAFGTGVTPFLAYIRYMAARGFGQGRGRSGTSFLLMASARTFSQLMCHEELLEIQRRYPAHFQYHPVLTRSWPSDWPWRKGRLMTVQSDGSGKDRIDLSGMLALAGDCSNAHLRLCGNLQACRHIISGLEQSGVVPLSLRSESW